jgi:hypothetical protein
MTLGELKAIVDAMHDLHGPDTWTTFVYQKSANRIGNGDITSYRTSVGIIRSIHFHVDSPVGKDDAK